MPADTSTAAPKPAGKTAGKSDAALAKQRAAQTTSEAATTRVLELHAKGLGRNAIAAEVGVGAATVTRIVKKAGLSFDRSQTRQATKARVDDTRARRADVSALLLSRANELLQQIDKPHLTFNIGGKDNIYTEHMLDRPPTGDIRNLVQAAATALGRHLDIERHDAEKGAADVRSMLGELGRALGVGGPPTE